MKFTIIAALLAVFLATPAYALQEPDKDKEKPQQQEPRKEEPKREEPKKDETPRQQPDRQQPQDKEKQQQQNRAQQQQEKVQSDRAKQSEKQQQQSERDRARQDKSAQDHPQETQRSEHSNTVQAQRDGGSRHTIKEQDFHSHFGREHEFRVARRDDRRFNYGGYWFVYSDPWPAAWSYDDEVYVDEIDGEYYLIDPVHPGLRLLLVVSD